MRNCCRRQTRLLDSCWANSATWTPYRGPYKVGPKPTASNPTRFPGPWRLELLCAVSVSSVSLWWILAENQPPQRHRGHRDSTEKREENSSMDLRFHWMLPKAGEVSLNGAQSPR